MNRKNVIVSIPEPCHEDWAKMSPCARGRFCTACQKNVLDFSEMSDTVISKILLAKEPVCGNFDATQLNRALPLAHPAPRNSWLYRAAALLLIPVAPFIAKAQHKVNIEQTQTTGKQARISGLVLDNMSGKPLYGMEIHATGLGMKYSNAKGEFHFSIPDNFPYKEILIEAKYTETSSKALPATSILPVSIPVPIIGTDTNVVLKRYPGDTLEQMEIITQPIRPQYRGAVSITREIRPSKTNIFRRSWYAVSKPFKKKPN
ncbi:hypothetical protein DBR32_07595 [Taibaiella sp. KBW10]|uniref:hypothetical protein n=1 Tax=Taibaiella sp. KBW10 TaxID=2153357 RepID=UPI000F5A64D5|nr:hypothetical protein [Taibaiella sp. KBW10]RQO31797.1 hypothetical protein DBR32_07595 [Taibaiella sp. KBW10]